MMLPGKTWPVADGFVLPSLLNSDSSGLWMEPQSKPSPQAADMSDTDSEHRMTVNTEKNQKTFIFSTRTDSGPGVADSTNKPAAAERCCWKGLLEGSSQSVMCVLVQQGAKDQLTSVGLSSRCQGLWGECVHDRPVGLRTCDVSVSYMEHLPDESEDARDLV
ncbi:hypothetical protein PAMP_017934 [Pampus punctatissimus]